jgi:hypothetical protein
MDSIGWRGVRPGPSAPHWAVYRICGLECGFFFLQTIKVPNSLSISDPLSKKNCLIWRNKASIGKRSTERRKTTLRLCVTALSCDFWRSFSPRKVGTRTGRRPAVAGAISTQSQSNFGWGAPARSVYRTSTERAFFFYRISGTSLKNSQPMYQFFG